MLLEDDDELEDVVLLILLQETSKAEIKIKNILFFIKASYLF